MLKKFVVKAAKGFLKDLDELPADAAIEIAKKVKMLETAPLPSGKNRVKKLKGFVPPAYRLRVGDKRVIYRITGKEVLLLTIIDRKELKRELKKLLR